MTIPEVSCTAVAVQNSSEWPCSLCPFPQLRLVGVRASYMYFLIFPGHSSTDLGWGGGCCKEGVHWRKLKVRSLGTFQWLTCGSLSLAELLLGEKESLLPPDKVVKEYLFLSQMQGTSIPVGVTHMRVLPSSLPTPF